MFSTIIFLIIVAFCMWLLIQLYNCEVSLGETEDALNRSRRALASEKEYVARLEKELLTYQPK